MNATAPPKPAATLINVEESRAQRLQRQQTRFRDRGGIFVPTNRSTLLDILLGKTSPLKKPRRSASASPSRPNEEKFLTGNEVSKPCLRRSPRKQSQRTLDVVIDEHPQDDSELEVSKPIKKVTFPSKSSRSRPQKKAKAPPKSTTKFLKAIAVVEDSVVDTNAKGSDTSHRPLTQKVSKRAVNASDKKSLKVSTKKIIPDADDDSKHDFALVKSKPVSETKPQGQVLDREVNGAKAPSKTRGRKPATATTSTAVAGSSRLKRIKKAEEPVYSELSADDSPKKASTTKVKKSAAYLVKTTSKTSSAQKGKRLSNLKQTTLSKLPDISEEDEEYISEKDGPPSSQGVKVSSLKDKVVVSRPAKSLNASDDDSDDDLPVVKSKSKNKGTSSQEKLKGEIGGAKRRPQPTKKVEFVYSELSEGDTALKPTKKPSTKKLLEDNVACKPTKKSTAKKVKASAAPLDTERCESSSSRKGKGASIVNETKPCQLPDIPEEDEKCNLEKEDTAPSEIPSNAVVAASKGKKRASTSITQDSDSQPRRKRIKSVTIQPDMDLPLDKKSNVSGEAPLVTAKKRRRNPEDAGSEIEDDVDKRAKRKKHSGPSESRRAPASPAEEDSAKPVAKRSSNTKVTKSTRKGKKQGSDNTTAASKRKENASMSKPSKRKVASNSGPPKSVLARIKDSLGAQVVDNEPDPIDFLS